MICSKLQKELIWRISVFEAANDNTYLLTSIRAWNDFLSGFFTDYTLNLFALMQAFYVKVANFYILQSKCKKRPIGFTLTRGKLYDLMQQRIKLHIFLHNVGTYIKFCSKLELVWANFSEVAFSIRILRERPLMTSHVFWPFLTYLPTFFYSITSDFRGYL